MNFVYDGVPRQVLVVFVSVKERKSYQWS